MLVEMYLADSIKWSALLIVNSLSQPINHNWYWELIIKQYEFVTFMHVGEKIYPKYLGKLRW